MRKPIKPPVDVNFSVRINARYESLTNYTRLYFQGGMRVDENDLDRWTPYCSLQVFNRSENSAYLTSVLPGSPDITQVKMYARSSDGVNYLPGYGMALGFGLSTRNASGRDWEPDGPPDYYLYEVQMRLKSTEQPDLQSLTCARKWSARGDYFPTLLEIRRALGELIRLQPMSISNRLDPTGRV